MEEDVKFRKLGGIYHFFVFKKTKSANILTTSLKIDELFFDRILRILHYFSTVSNKFSNVSICFYFAC